MAPVPVCFVASGQAGGAERYLETLLRAFDPGWIGGAVLIGEGPFAGTLEGLGVEVEVIGSSGRRGVPAAALALRRALRERRPPLVHANGIVPAAVAGLATLGTSTPILWLKVDMSWDGWRTRLIARRCAEVVGMSRAAVESLQGIRGTKVSIVEGGIPELGADPARGRAKLAAAFDEGDDEGAAYVALSGRLSPGKGQIELVEAAPGLLEARPQLRFALIGKQDPAFEGYDETLRERIRELGLDEAFALLLVERAEEAIELVSGADLVVAPSMRAESRWGEGFGLVVAEALQLGVPVVAYASGSLPEVLGDCGATVPEGDREGLVREVLALLDDERSREAAECGRRRAAERFEIERAAADMCEHYAALAAFA